MVKFHVRQATDASRDPVIMRFIREVLKENGVLSPIDLERFKKHYPTKYNELVSKCCNRGGCELKGLGNHLASRPREDDAIRPKPLANRARQQVEPLRLFALRYHWCHETCVPSEQYSLV